MAHGTSISNRSTGALSGGCGTALLVAFLGLFCAVGIGVGWFLSFNPLYSVWQSRAWPPTDCEVVSSRLETGDDTARPDIQYRYFIDGRTYISGRYNFVPGKNNIGNHAAVVDQYPAGRHFECFVDPADPTEAVINRDLNFEYYFGLIFFAGFTGIPGIIIAFVAGSWLRGRRTASPSELSPAAAVSFGEDEMRASTHGPVVLKPGTTPLGKLIGITLAALFWNGITGVFTYMEYSDFAGGATNWFLVIFLIPFQLVGLALILGIPYQILALANPRPTITLSQPAVPIGGSLSLEWQLTGAASRVSALRLALEGREEARYRRGTDTHTDRHVFHTATIVEATDSMGIARGSASVRIPPHTMHSFESDNNKIAWTLKMHGDVNRWPDIDESFDITVRPR